MKVGIVPGAMKPYHAGHHYLVETAIANCDKVIILTTTKTRGIISGDGMRTIWEDYIIPWFNVTHGDKVEVRFVTSPIRSVYVDFIERLEEQGPDGNEYLIYGGTEDLARFASDKLKAKYPTAAKYIMNVAESDAANFLRGVGNSPQAKGSWIREALVDGNVLRFQAMLPHFLHQYAEEIMKLLLVT